MASIYVGMTGSTTASSATAAETEELGRARERDGGAGERRKRDAVRVGKRVGWTTMATAARVRRGTAAWAREELI